MMGFALIATLILAIHSTPDTPQWPGEYASLKVLNNFVTELYSSSAEPGKQQEFLNPRTGWVFITSKGASPIFLDDRKEPVVWRQYPDSGDQEAMLHLKEGRHHFRVEGSSPVPITIRTMPELAYCYYPASPHIAPFGPYDWAFVSRHVLPHVNTLITGGGATPEEFEQWRCEGRQWIANASLPGLSQKTAPSADDVFAEWAKNAGVTQSGYAGMIVDEFLGSSKEHYAAWTSAFLRLIARPEFSEKTFYAWSITIFEQPQGLEFCKLLMNSGHRFAWEVYRREEQTLEKAKERLAQTLSQKFAEWRTALPGVEGRMMLTLGYLCAPPETLNLNPGVDYNVFMDMQFNLLANDPAFWNLYGVMEYSASYADEESLRWAHKLFRHYCIEGHRTPLTHDPYILDHLKNPDFAVGLKKWRVKAAEKGSIRPCEKKDFSWLQGRYPKTTIGDQFCVMKRSSKGQNRISQTIHDLEPGRLYSVKMISADLTQLDKQQTLGMHIEIKKAERFPAFSIQSAYPSCYNHTSGPYDCQHPAWFNFHREVFKAIGRSAKLVISDQGCVPGQEIAFNFIEVQPFHAP
ncbi:MAG TPA: hypothetical protein PLI09_24040 [Candidatus Hydrogenedentes bacterium]|nr:hypothetical protein [Candidatus Hydrogenedentota bacterium]